MRNIYAVLQGTEIFFAILLLTAYCSRDVNPEVVSWSGSNKCSIVFKHPVASVYNLFHIYPSLMQLASHFVYNVSAIHGYCQVSNHYAKTAVLQGVSSV
jgi:hypothetical protein